jgi:hypothetical protein
MNNLLKNTFPVYNTNGVRIFGQRINGGYRLVKFDINLALDFNPSITQATIRAEFLRNGRIFTSSKEMYAYLMKYRRHTLRDFSGVRRPNNHKSKIPTKWDRARSKAVFAKRMEVFGTCF